MNVNIQYPCVRKLSVYFEEFITIKILIVLIKFFALFLVQKDACGQIGSGPACCTHEIMNSYASTLGIELKTLFDTELSHLIRLLSTSKQQIDGKSILFI
jgi:hypothetical protein